MPNGRPGDHPLTDILTHGLEVYGREVDDLVRKIAQLSAVGELDDWWMLEIAPEADATVILQRSRARLAELETLARESGWEPDSQQDLQDWQFEIREISAGRYVAQGHEPLGRSVSREGAEPDELLKQAQSDALAIMAETGNTEPERQRVAYSAGAPSATR